MAKITFIYDDTEEGGRACKVQVDELFWSEVTDAYIDFLRGCGYVLTVEDVSDYIKDRVNEYEGALCAGCCDKRHGGEEVSGAEHVQDPTVPF